MGKHEEITAEYKDLFFHISQGSYPTAHSHNGYWELILVTQGKLINIVNGARLTLSEGSLTLLRPNDSHSIEASDMTTRFMLGVRSEYMKNYVNGISPEIYGLLLAKPQIATVTLDKAKLAELTQIENAILLSDDDRQYRTLQYIFVSMMQEVLFADLMNAHTTSHYSKPVKTLLQLISNQDNLNLSMPELIRQTTYSYSHINRLFLQEMGETLNDYLRKKRLGYAQNLLINTDKSLKEIAYLVGYNNYSNFSLFFQQKTGKTPAKYRNESAENNKS